MYGGSSDDGSFDDGSPASNNADDRGVRHAGRRLRLQPEPGAEGGVASEVGIEDLDRDLTAERQVESAIDLGHSAMPDELVDAVSTRDDSWLCGHVLPPGKRLRLSWIKGYPSVPPPPSPSPGSVAATIGTESGGDADDVRWSPPEHMPWYVTMSCWPAASAT